MISPSLNPLSLQHWVDRRYRFSVNRDFINVLPLLFEQWQWVESYRLNRAAASLVVSLSAGVGYDSWLRMQNDTLIEIHADKIRSSYNNDQDKDELVLVADGTQAEIAASQAITHSKLIPPRLRLPLFALALTTFSLPFELPFFPILLIVLLAGGRCFDRARISLWGRKRLNVDVLDALALVIHSLEGFLFGPALMLSMIEGGESIRDATARAACSSNRSLKADLNREVKVRRGAQILSLRLAEVTIGDVVLLFAGDQVPVDGTVLVGQSSLDVRSLTGESVPRYVEPGDEVLASSMLIEGYIEVSTIAVGDHTKAGQIAQLLHDAPVCDTRVGNYAAKVADKFVLPTLALSALSFGLFGSISQAASLLMLDLGTGLRVSVPTSILASLNRAASEGILIRSGRALEALADVDVVVFDKTGTLTTGEPELLHIEVLDDLFTQYDILQLAASAEQGLNHPIALAITEAAKRYQLSLLPIDQWSCEIGRGVCAIQAGRKLLVGNRRLLRDGGIDPPPINTEPHLRVATQIIVAVDGRLAGIIYVSDSLRPDSLQLVESLMERGIQSHLLTGDSEAVALQVGMKLGLSRAQIHAEALPDVKADVVQRLKAQGHRVAFVGDGLNDSAALAYADVAISFYHGSDIAKDTAEIVLSGENIIQLLEAYELAKFSFSIVKQNIAIVGVPNLSALLIGVLLPIHPLLAIFINNGSCIFAALNALRPLRFTASSRAFVPQTKEIVQKTVPSQLISQTLNNKQLSLRLGVSSQKLVARRCKPDFSRWSASIDPENLLWLYQSDLNTFTTQSSANNLQ
jgi:heavy metal translocating P-type ATPase